MSVRIDHDPRWRWLPAIAILLLLAAFLPGIATAAVEPVGRVISASGDVTAVRAGESARSLGRGDSVYEGDEIRTGNRGNAQVRFVDSGLFALEPDTRFAVDRYRTADDESAGSAIMSFLRGALRTITGAIGAGEEDTYRVNTPTATIGVRGTGYALYYCDADCADSFGGGPGLYGRVDDGRIRVRTPRGSGDFGAGRFFFVPEGGTPRSILKPPRGILDGNDEGGDDGGGIAEVAQLLAPRDDTDEPIFEAGDLFRLGGGVAAAGMFGRTGSFFSDAQLFDGSGLDADDQGRVIAAAFDSGLDVRVDGAELTEFGSFANLNVGWGRWNGPLLVDGTSTTGNLAFTVTDNFTAPTTLGGLSGTLNYSLAGVSGGPKAFDSNSMWTVNALDLAVDFTAGVVGLTTFDLAQEIGNLSALFGPGDVTNSILDLADNGLRLDIDNKTDATGTIAGKFVGTNAEGMIVIFTVDHAQGVRVTGTKVLEEGVLPQ